MGHVLNLAAQSFLFVTDKEMIELRPDEEVLTLDEIATWRAKGCLGQLHNIVVWIQTSPQRMNRFLALSRNHRLARDNKTRWNSWYNMIRIATTKPCHQAIIEYFELYPEECRDDQLSTEQWQQLINIRDFLAKISEATMVLQGFGGRATLSSVLQGIEFVMDAFEKAKLQFADDPFLLPMINSGWSKLDKYYQLTDTTPAYVAAIVFDSTLKWQYFDSHWKPEWIPAARESIQRLWDDFKPAVTETPAVNSSPVARARDPNSFSVWMAERVDKKSDLDEYERYCMARRTFSFDPDAQPYSWWLEPQQQKEYPNLSRLAVDILSIPAMSDLVEKVFSSAKQTLVDRRIMLGADALEATECLRSWLAIEDFEEKVVAKYGEL